MNQLEIQSVLPHRYPFLLIDRVTEFVPGQRIAGVKTFTNDEPYQPGYFPQGAVVPCGILLEMTTQLGAILVLEQPGMKDKIAMILQIPSARIHSLAIAGDALRVEAEILKLRENFGELEGKVYRGGDLVAEGRMRFAIAEKSAARSL
ncbi:MAG TPA: 3-hydroxyacyl-[acyl-carrier-protein] dehydratase FabZ [Terriglobia bacterium]|nr:3-hydroxyacyl-[acyl-carrier-protein] dehydratase FabZ [Terriglobia bacterium]